MACAAAGRARGQRLRLDGRRPVGRVRSSCRTSAASAPTCAARPAATMRPAAARTSDEAARAPGRAGLAHDRELAPARPPRRPCEKPAGISRPAAARPSAIQGSKSAALLRTTRTASELLQRRHELLRLRPAVGVVQGQRQPVAAAAEEQAEEGREGERHDDDEQRRQPVAPRLQQVLARQCQDPVHAYRLLKRSDGDGEEDDREGERDDEHAARRRRSAAAAHRRVPAAAAASRWA